MRKASVREKWLASALAFLALAVLAEPAQAQTINICKRTIPAGGTGFPFIWTSGSTGPTSPFTLDDGQCQPFPITGDRFNQFTENVPSGWSLTNISCNQVSSPVRFLGGNADPAFQPGDNRVTIDLNEMNVTCTFTNRRVETPPAMDVYAVKFLCGSYLSTTPDPTGLVEGPVKPGNYLTAINVHNPNRIPVSYRRKAVLLYRADNPPAPEMPMPPGPLFPAELGPDWGVEIDCSDIRNRLLGGTVPPPIFIKGWVVIEVTGTTANPTPPLLDITAVYTSHGWDQNSGAVPVYKGFSEDVEQILPKRVQ